MAAEPRLGSAFAVKNRRLPVGGQEGREAAGVIVMTVTQDQGCRGTEIGAEGAGVVFESGSLPGIEKETFVVRIDPGGEAVLGDQPRGRFVVD